MSIDLGAAAHFSARFPIATETFHEGLREPAPVVPAPAGTARALTDASFPPSPIGGLGIQVVAGLFSSIGKAYEKDAWRAEADALNVGLVEMAIKEIASERKRIQLLGELAPFKDESQ